MRLAAGGAMAAKSTRSNGKSARTSRKNGATSRTNGSRSHGVKARSNGARKRSNGANGSAGDVGETNLGLSRAQRAGSIAALNEALANTSILNIKTKKFHWDVVGPQFMSLHKLWDEQYETLAEYADEIAERARMLGGFPIGTAKGFLRLTVLEEYPGDVPDATHAVQTLLSDHESIVRSLRKAIDRCESEYEDKGTADFLTGLLKGHEKMAWMLRSFLLGTPVIANGQITTGVVPSLA